MTKNKFIVLEGLDGSGKSTQIKNLTQYYEGQNIKYKYLHFPRTDAPYFGELIARFLRGEFGSLNEVDPYIVALLYAGDRHHAANMIREWLDNGYIVLLDRYVNSNIGFQCAKLKNKMEQLRLKNWILDLEYNHFKLPRPDISIFLDVPFSFTKHKLTTSREGEERDYLKGKQDIHEGSMEFQKKVREIYKLVAGEDEKFQLLKCYNDQHKIFSPEVIFGLIKETLEY